jgi:hypothetical protein
MSTGGRLGFDADNFSDLSLCYTHRPSEGPTSHCPLSIGGLDLGVKRPECETALSPPSIAEVKNEWKYNLTVPHIMKPELL